MEAWASMRLPAPPLEEQARISEHVVRATAALDRLSEQAEVAMTLLAERKAALIASAVTGKIDVRSHAAVPSAGKLDLRLIVGSAIVRSLARKPTFGRVKFQKLLFLAEVHAGFDLGGKYTREAAGPLDRNLVADVERRLFQAGKVEILQPDGKGGQVEYRPANSGTKLETELAQLPEPAGDRLTCLIGLFADLDTRCTEAVTTLYAVWNDALIDGRQPTVKEIIDEVLNNWHPEKKEKFRADELETWLGWIDRQGLVPTGTGPKTQLGRLFA
jgi:type I restriction enzyme S subunit